MHAAAARAARRRRRTRSARPEPASNARRASALVPPRGFARVPAFGAFLRFFIAPPCVRRRRGGLPAQPRLRLALAEATSGWSRTRSTKPGGAESTKYPRFGNTLTSYSVRRRPQLLRDPPHDELGQVAGRAGRWRDGRPRRRAQPQHRFHGRGLGGRRVAQLAPQLRVDPGLPTHSASSAFGAEGIPRPALSADIPRGRDARLEDRLLEAAHLRLGLRFEEQGGEAGHVRRGHRRAVHRLVPPARLRGHDADAGGHEVGHDGVLLPVEPLAGGEVGHAVVLAARPHGEGLGVVAGRPARAGVLVAHGEDGQDALLAQDAGDREEVGPPPAKAERQAQHARPEPEGPVHAPEHAGDRVAALDHHGAREPRPGRHSDVTAADRAARDRARGVRAVLVAVARLRGGLRSARPITSNSAK